ncbi:zinc ribbon domain-containing protein [Halomarina pelagica]|uniref:zinc ribbon domain-containing protein n=1 Tax=Halomarina pelagica TaxID=2961599 RepID=UPI0020C40E4A|nr:zinc ribbon domain-containing protein [Halomarina sp. BND7]
MRKRRPWFAVALAFVYPGLGHVYLREWLRALLWFLLTVATAVLVVPASALDGGSLDAVLRAQRNLPISALLAILAVTAFSMFDAYRLAAHGRAAERSRRSGRPGSTPSVASTSSGASADVGGNASGDASADTRCPNCRRTVEAGFDFCPWCAAEFDANG